MTNRRMVPGDAASCQGTGGVECPTVLPQSLAEELHAGRAITLVDIRDAAELRNGVLAGALHIPMDSLLLSESLAQLPVNTPIVLYCARGVRSEKARLLLLGQGFPAVRHLESGFDGWKSLGLPVSHASPCLVATSVCDRYDRQIRLAEVGLKGQERLRLSRVLVVGIGGLGSPVALYLAGAGVGTLGLVDSEAVELSNLHRQIIYDSSRIGELKVESARQRLAGANEQLRVLTYPERICAENIERILSHGWDVIVDGTDSIPTRYLLNDVARRRGIALCHGAVDRFEGHVTTFLGSNGPCYRCLFPHPPPPAAIGSCQERGVLGVLPGIIGVLQATEVLKLILGIGAPLAGRLVLYDALSLQFNELRYEQDADCITCKRERKET